MIFTVTYEEVTNLAERLGVLAAMKPNAGFAQIYKDAAVALTQVSGTLFGDGRHHYGTGVTGEEVVTAVEKNEKSVG